VASYADLQAEHQALLARLDRGEPPAAVLDAVRAFIARAQGASAGIASARDRDQLRANLRFWGSFVFDQTGVYPDTTLRPGPTSGATDAPGAPPPSRPLALGPLLLAGLVGLLCLALVVVAGLVALNASGLLWPGVSATEPGPASLTPGPILTVVVTDATPGPPVTPDLTETETVGDDMTATATAAAPTPTPTEAVVLGSLMLADVTLSAGLDCGARTALVSVAGGGPIPPAEAAGAVVELRRARSREAEAAAQFKGEGEVVALRVEVFDDEESEPFLLSVVHPTLVFSDLILQFGAGCSDNVAEVRFVATEAAAGPGAPPAAGDLEIGWELIAWGPAPEDPGAWVAQVELFADGGDGNYIFWDGETHSTNSPDILLSERACGLARRTVGVSSAGRSVLREIILQAPGCSGAP